MKLRAFAGDICDFRPAVRQRQGINMRRLWKMRVKKIAAAVADYDWEQAPLTTARHLDAFCTGVILLAILYFLPILVSLFRVFP